MRKRPDLRTRRRLADQMAAVLVRLGGVGIVLAVLSIAVFLVVEAAPLAFAPRLAESNVSKLPEVSDRTPILAQGVDAFGEARWILRASGALRLRRIEDGSLLAEQEPFLLAKGERLVLAKLGIEQQRLSVATSRGRLATLALSLKVDYHGGAEGEGDLERHHSLGELKARWLLDGDGKPLRDFDLHSEDGKIFALTIDAGGSARLLRGEVKTNRLTGAERFKLKSLVVPGGGWERAGLFEGGAGILVAADGSVEGIAADRRFRELEERGRSESEGSVLAIQALIGRGSLLLLRGDGSVERWSMRPRPDGGPRIDRAWKLQHVVDGPRTLVPATRGRVFFVIGRKEFAIGQATLGRILLRRPMAATTDSLAVSPRQDRLVLFDRDGSLKVTELNLEYPGIGWSTLFGKVLYEGAPEPAWVWQSTGGTDSYEPKLSFVPLIIGTLKGTLWSLLPSLPLALLGALFTARFLSGRAREIVKPLVELLAGIPSVILGFVAALYLAPAIEQRMLVLFLLPLVLGTLTAALAIGWARLPVGLRTRVGTNAIPFLLMGLYLLVAWQLFRHGPAIEEALLGSSFRIWYPDHFGLPFEQRNSVVVGLAMGFAVTPLVFTLAEDAFRNIPRTLSDASLALGATPWQTAVRVIVPPAKPGVIAAIMLGLGRAVGETMIVLMATGNTPITSMNIFQGFRALSANLAVELPEAPVGGGLYRTLFLSALLLFGFTFLINTLAEMMRVRGRKRL